MNKVARRVVFLTVFALVGVYGFFSLRGPQGISALMQKRQDIRRLEEENAAFLRENKYREERIRKLTESSSEQELEIRKRLKLLRPGETMFVLPEQPKQDATPAPPKQ